MEEKNYNMIDNAAGLCAGIATYKLIETRVSATYHFGGGIVRTGCQLIQAFCGVKVGVAVRDEVHKVRTGLIKMKGESL